MTALKFDENITLGQVLLKMDESGTGITCFLDEQNKVFGVFTDGDARRVVLSGCNMNTPIKKFINRNFIYLTEKSKADPELLCLHNKIRHIPVVDKNMKFLYLYSLDKVRIQENIDIPAIIMAGGLGVRMGELVKDNPKPMLKVKKAPLLEHIIERLKYFGIKKIYISVNYKKQKIIDYFGNGDELGVQIKYLEEKKRLGTAGALSLFKKEMELLNKNKVLVINGDVLSSVDYGEFVKFHDINNNEISVATKVYEQVIPYGVLELKNNNIKKINEKPVVKFVTAAGIYILSKDVINQIKEDSYYDMNELIQKIIKLKESVRAFPIYESWVDIGRPDDYHRVK